MELLVQPVIKEEREKLVQRETGVAKVQLVVMELLLHFVVLLV